LKNPLYTLYGLALLGLTSYAQYSGFSLTRINQQKVPPKTIRDNPGAYRPMYGGYSRYIGGK
jgi:hypothetical protein